MSELPSKLRVAICGGGIASKFTEIGAGIGVYWRTRQVLKSLGLEDDVIRLLTFRPGQDRVPTIQHRKSDQPDGLAMGVMYSRGGLMGFHRAEFHEVLLNRLPSRCRTLPSKRLESYVQQPGAPIVLNFKDGSTATCDILIGADGVKSVVRKTMLQEAATWAESYHRNSDAAELRNLCEPRFSGFFAYRTLIPAATLSKISPQHRAFSTAVRYLGKNRHIITFPISHGRFVNFAAFEFHPEKEGTHFDGPWVIDVDPSYVQGLFHGWEKEANELVQCLGGLKISRWVVNVIPTLPFFSFGNVAILGDAAHAMTPYLGAGAGQAIEDALTLASLLSNKLATKATAYQALGVYSRVRQPFATEAARRSHLIGEHISLCSFTGPDQYEPSSPSSTRFQGFMKPIQENFEWVSESDASVDLQRAVNLISKELARL